MSRATATNGDLVMWTECAQSELMKVGAVMRKSIATSREAGREARKLSRNRLPSPPMGHRAKMTRSYGPAVRRKRVQGPSRLAVAVSLPVGALENGMIDLDWPSLDVIYVEIPTAFI